MSHERSVTITIGDKHYNVPSVINGKQEKDVKKIRDYHTKNKSLGKPYKTIPEAVAAAKARSKSFDEPKKNVFERKRSNGRNQ